MNHSLNYLVRLILIAEIMSSSMAKSLILQRSAFPSHKEGPGNSTEFDKAARLGISEHPRPSRLILIYLRSLFLCK